jgi:Family of unknown function (DUF5372)
VAERGEDPSLSQEHTRFRLRLSPKLSTTAGAVDPPLIRIVHPFHPLRGQTFRFVVAKQLWGDDRVTVERPDGSLCSVPVGWTDFVPADPYLSVGLGRSRFRVEDLRALADLVAPRGTR